MICEYCGKDFGNRPPSCQKRTKHHFCSKSCWYAYRSAMRKVEYDASLFESTVKHLGKTINACIKQTRERYRTLLVGRKELEQECLIAIWYGHVWATKTKDPHTWWYAVIRNQLRTYCNTLYHHRHYNDCDYQLNILPSNYNNSPEYYYCCVKLSNLFEQKKKLKRYAVLLDYKFSPLSLEQCCEKWGCQKDIIIDNAKQAHRDIKKRL